METKNVNPATYLGFGTWVAWGEGRVPVGVNTNDNDFKTVEKTGGEKTHKLTIEEMPPHDHPTLDDAAGLFANWGDKTSADGYVSASVVGKGGNFRVGYTGGGKAHNNLPPYITCYMWKRTA